jgi:hypothetical protein
LIATQRAAAGVADAAAASAAAPHAEKAKLAAKTDHVTRTQRQEIEDIDALVRDGSHCVLWCWLPCSNRWTTSELLERTTRAVTACRAHDLIALPDLPLAHELVEHWHVADYGCDHLQRQNVIWFDAQPQCDKACTSTEAGCAADPAFVTLRHVLEEYEARHKSEATGLPRAALCCMYPDTRIATLAARHGLRCLGDLDEHPVIGPLSRAKSFLHRSLASPDRPSLCDATLANARGPRGFCCETADQLFEAWERLTTADPAIRLVLKPASGSGGSGVVLDATRADVVALAAQMRRERKGRFLVRPVATDDEETILEEMVGTPGKPSPTVYMVGSSVAVVADQLLTPCGTINLGNVSPGTQVGSATVETMKHACVELGRHLGLVGQWGVDFVLDERGTPVMVDLNMGRPNGSLSYYCWRARQPDPKASASGGGGGQRALALVASTWVAPVGLRLTALAASLKANGLLWDAKRACGVVLAQHLPGHGSGTVLAASWEGTDAAKGLLEAFHAHANAQLVDLA